MKFSGLIFLIIALASNVIGQQTKGTSSQEVRTRMINLATRLENEPLAADAQENRKEMFIFINSSSGLNIKCCPYVLGDLKQITGDYSADLIGQLAFSQAKFALEHPQQIKNSYAKLLAGVTGVVKAYKNIKKAKPEVAIPGLDLLVKKEKRGQLGLFVKTNMSKCK